MYDKLTKLEGASSTPVVPQTEEEINRKLTREPTELRNPSSEKTSAKSRENIREKSRALPTRDEIQEFSFRLRDELKTKVQAEVPHKWHKELEDLSRKLNVKKLELYRYILGEFLGKVNRKDT